MRLPTLAAIGQTIRPSRLVGFLLMALVMGTHVWLGDDKNGPWRHDWWDKLHQLAPRDRGDPKASPAVVVAIDEDTMAARQRWPWPRDMVAELVEKLHGHGAGAVAFDIMFIDADPQSPLAQSKRFAKNKTPDGRMVSRLLSRVVKHLGDTDEKLALAINAAAQPPRGGRLMPTVMPLTGVPQFEGVDPDAECKFSSPYITMDPADLDLGEGFYSADVPLELFRAAGALVAAINFSASGDFVVRRVKAVQKICQAPFLLLGVEALRAKRQDYLTTITETPSGLSLTLVDPDKPDQITFPAEQDGSFWLHFGHVGVPRADGTGRDLPRYISARDVLEPGFDASRVAGKIVFLAVVDLGRIDERLSPLGEIIYGVEAHMQMVEQIVAGDFLRRPWFMFALETLVMGLICLLVIMLVPRAPPVVSILLIPLGIAALLFISFGLFKAGVLIDLASPSLALMFVGGGVMGLTLIERDRARLMSEIELQSERADRSFLQGELDAAARIQTALLPSTRFNTDTRVDLACYIDPARTVGGDFYDHFMIDERHLFFLVADVSGKGADASQFMLLSKTLWKSVALRTGAPLERIQLEANAEITRENTATMFVTGLCGLLDLESLGLNYSSAGHDAPYRFAEGMAPEQLAPFSGPPAGLMDGLEFPVGQVQLVPGDRLCIFTDGVTEAMDAAGELFGMERLESALEAAPPGLDSAGLVDHIVGSVRSFTGNAEQSDDLTLMVISIPGS